MQDYIISIKPDLKWHTLIELKETFNWTDKVGKFYCSGTQLISLEGAPKECDEFYCNINMLKDDGLKGGPEIVHKVYQCEKCSLTSLMYAPMKVEVFDAEDNIITSLAGIGRKYLKNCTLMNLEKNKIQSNILGLVIVEDLSVLNIFGENRFFCLKMLEFAKNGRDVLEAQEWLLDQGKKELAKM